MTDHPPTPHNEPHQVATERAAYAFEDADYPPHHGRAAEMLGVTTDFLRSLDSTDPLAPARSHGDARGFQTHPTVPRPVP